MKRVKLDKEVYRRFYVYALFRPDCGDICYIGKGHGRRYLAQSTTPGNNKHLRNIVGKYGPLIPVKIRTNLTERDAFVIEIALIAAIGRRDNGTGPLVNQTAGGEGTIDKSPEAKLKISITTKQRMSDPVQLARIGKKTRERLADPEVKRVWRERMLRMRADPVTGPGLRAGYKGPHTQETKQLIGEKARIRMQDPKAREQIGLTLLGHTQSIETRTKRANSMLDHYEQRRQLGLSLTRRAKDETARREAIRATMKAHWEKKKGLTTCDS